MDSYLKPIDVRVPWDGNYKIEPITFQFSEKRTRLEFVHKRRKYIYVYNSTRTRGSSLLLDGNGNTLYSDIGKHSAFAISLHEAARQATVEYKKSIK